MIRLLLFSFLGVTLWTGSENQSRTINRKFAADQQTTLKINNKFGKIEIQEWDKKEIDITVTISTTETNPAKVNRLLDQVSIDIQNPSNEVIYTTRVEKSIDGKVEINYLVKMPVVRKFELQNSFGDVYVNEVNTPVSVRLSYGNLNGGSFLKEAQLAMDFSKGEITYFKSGMIDFSYSDFEITEIEKAEMVSKFTEVSISRAGTLDLDIKYGQLELGEVNDVVTDAHFTEVRIDWVKGSCRARTNYVGDFKVNRLSSSFTGFTYEGQYSPLYLKLDPDVSAKFAISTSNADLSNTFVATNYFTSIRESGRSEFEGEFGTGSASKMVRVESSYGSVKIR